MDVFKFNDYVSWGWSSIGIVASEVNKRTGEYYVYDFIRESYILVPSDKLRSISEKVIKKLLARKVKIINYEESAKIFNYKRIKSKLVGQEFSEYQIESRYKCKIDGIVRDTIIVYTDDDKKYRFVESDCEYLFDIPKITLQKHKEDSIIKVGDTVRVLNSKRLPIEKNTICQVVGIRIPKSNYRNKKGEKVSNNIVATIMHNDKSYPILIKHLKKVKNDTNNRQQESLLPF